MSRTSTTRFLLAYFAIVWGAMLLRFDRFPLTWAPMYSTSSRNVTVSSKVLDKDLMRKGLIATYQDGTTGFVSMFDLNVPKWNFWRLYYQRMFGNGPNKFKQGNANMSRFNRRLRGLGPDENGFEADWDWRVLRSVNRTLEREPGDPGFVVRLEARFERIVFPLDDLKNWTRRPEVAVIEWNDAWRSRWDAGGD